MYSACCQGSSKVLAEDMKKGYKGVADDVCHGVGQFSDRSAAGAGGLGGAGLSLDSMYHLGQGVLPGELNAVAQPVEELWFPAYAAGALMSPCMLHGPGIDATEWRVNVTKVLSSFGRSWR